MAAQKPTCILTAMQIEANDLLSVRTGPLTPTPSPRGAWTRQRLGELPLKRAGLFVLQAWRDLAAPAAGFSS